MGRVGLGYVFALVVVVVLAFVVIFDVLNSNGSFGNDFSPTGMAPYFGGGSENFISPINSFTLSTSSLSFSNSSQVLSLVVKINDSLVYKTGYVSLKSGGWQPIALNTQGVAWMPNWYNNSGNITLTFTAANFSLSPGQNSSENYIVLYSCNRTGNNFDCHSNKWQIHYFNVSLDSGVPPQSNDSGLVGHWKFDDNSGSVAHDSSGNALDGTIEGVPNWSNGMVNGALNFDGNENVVVLPPSSKLIMGGNSFTFATWVYPSYIKLGDWNAVLGGNGGSASFGLHSGYLKIQKVTTEEGPSSDYGVGPNTWTHLAVVFDSFSATNNVKYYVNGALVNTVTFDQDFAGQTKLIGRTFGISGDFYGLLDDVRIYNRTLQPIEIAALANVLPPQVCSDSDNGIVNSTKGYVNITNTTTWQSVIFWDNCSSAILNEAYCSGNNLAWQSVNCGAGGCVNGACVQPNSCVDSDGTNASTRGNVSGYYSNVYYSFIDFCYSSSVVTEYYCSGALSGSTNISCSSGQNCSNGACTTPSVCGNGAVDAGEMCDGSNLNGQSCASLGYASGTLSCNACSYDVSGCVWGQAEGIESYYDYINLSNYQNIIYINPNYNGVELGTQAQPYNSWSDVKDNGLLQSNTAFLQMRGTFATGGEMAFRRQSNILIWVYGPGTQRAVVNLKFQFFDCRDVIVADYFINGTPNPRPLPGTAGIKYDKSSNFAEANGETENILFLNNRLSYAGIGLLNWNDENAPPNFVPHGPIRDIKIIGNEVGPAYSDGITMLPILTSELVVPESDNDNVFSNVEVGYNYVHDVNQDWMEFNRILQENDTALYPNIQVVMHEGSLAFYCPLSNQYAHHCPDREIATECLSSSPVTTNGYVPFGCGGDAYQFANAWDLWFHDNIASRETTGNKFGAIFSSVDYVPQPRNAIVERNTFIGPNTGGSGGTQLAFYGRGGTVVVRHNKFLSPHSWGILTNTLEDGSIDIYGNVFEGGYGGILYDSGPVGSSVNVFNNVFSKVSDFDLSFATSSSGSIRNNIFLYPAGGKSEASIENTPVGYVGGNNLFSQQYSNMFRITGPPNVAYAFAPSDIFGDPKFVDVANNDFHVQASSPAINNGTMTGLPVNIRDIDGDVIPIGSAPDIGVDESMYGAPLRLLFIGNSWLYLGPVHNVVSQLAVSKGFPQPVIGSNLLDAYDLSNNAQFGHRANATTLALIDQGNWDYVVLVDGFRPTDEGSIEVGSLDDSDPGAFKNDVTWFYNRVKASSPEAKIVLFESVAPRANYNFWGAPMYPTYFDNPMDMQSQLKYHYEDAAYNYVPAHATFSPSNDISVALAGDAWEQHLYFEPNPLTNMFRPDGNHGNSTGQYLTSLMIFSEIYNSPVQGATDWIVSSSDALRLRTLADGMNGYNCGNNVCQSGETCLTCADCGCSGGTTCSATTRTCT